MESIAECALAGRRELAGWTFDEYLSTYDEHVYMKHLESGLEAAATLALGRLTAAWKRKGMSERHIRGRQRLFRMEFTGKMRELRGRAQ